MAGSARVARTTPIRPDHGVPLRFIPNLSRKPCARLVRPKRTGLGRAVRETGGHRGPSLARSTGVRIAANPLCGTGPNPLAAHSDCHVDELRAPRPVASRRVTGPNAAVAIRQAHAAPYRVA